MNYPHNKENILTNTSENLTLPHKAKLSKEQMIIMRRTNAKQVQEIAFEKQQQIEQIKKKFEEERKALVEKYQQMILQKDAYIKELEEICAGTRDIQKQICNHKQITDKQPDKQGKFGKKYSIPNTFYLHQTPPYQELCYSIERPIQNKTQRVGEFLNNKSMKNRLLSGDKLGRNGGESTKRSGSNSRHKLVPAPQPNFKKIL